MRVIHPKNRRTRPLRGFLTGVGGSTDEDFSAGLGGFGLGGFGLGEEGFGVNRATGAGAGDGG